MRIKRILITLLVALMMFTLVAFSSAAEDKDTSFDIVAEATNSSAMLSEGVFSNTEDGIEIEVVLNVKSNPGIYLLSLDFVYNPEKMQFVSYTNGVLFDTEKGATVNVKDSTTPGCIKVFCYSDQGDVNGENVALVSVKFKVLVDCYDSLDDLKLDFVKPYSKSVDDFAVNVEQCSLKVHHYAVIEGGIKEATCTEPGKTSYKCSKCDATHEVITSDLAPHNMTEATCTTLSTCTECGYTEGELAPHTWLDATCTADKTCSECGETEEGTMLEHNMSEATCTTLSTCTECGHTEGELKPHNMTEATCTAPSTCTECGHTEGEVLPHSFGAWSTAVAPTTSAAGEEKRTCSACNKVETRTVEKLPVMLSAPTEAWKGDGVLVFKSDAPFANFVSVKVNGEVLAAENYTVEDGSTIVTLSEKYLGTLENGQYKLCIESTNGSVEADFEIANSSSGWIVAIVIIVAVVVCAGVVVGVVFYKKKKAAN